MNSPNLLDLNLTFSGFPLSISVGPDAYRCQSGWDAGPHSNADFEVHLLLSGSCAAEIGSEELALAAPCAIFIPPGVYHCLRNPSADFEWFCFGFASAAKRFSQLLCEQLPAASVCALSSETITLCRLILEEMLARCAFWEDSLRSYFLQLLVSLFRSAKLQFSQPAASHPTGNWRTAIIDDFFSPVYGRFATEDELADSLQLSRRQLHRILLQKFGMGFRQKMLQTRMEYSKNLLRTTDHNVETIGSMAGYTVPSSFYKAFRSYYHTTPQQYRQLLKK